MGNLAFAVAQLDDAATDVAQQLRSVRGGLVDFLQISVFLRYNIISPERARNYMKRRAAR